MDPLRSVQPRQGRERSVTGVPCRPGPGVGRDDPGQGGYLADLVVRAVADVEIPVRRDRDAPRRVQPRGGGQTEIACRAWAPVPGDRGDDSGRGGDLADLMISRVGDVEVSAR